MGIRELKQNPSVAIALAKSGQSVTVSERGEPVALIVPIPKDPIELLIAQGKLSRAEGFFDVRDIKPSGLKDLKSEDLISESREERI